MQHLKKFLSIITLFQIVFPQYSYAVDFTIPQLANRSDLFANNLCFVREYPGSKRCSNVSLNPILKGCSLVCWIGIDRKQLTFSSNATIGYLRFTKTRSEEVAKTIKDCYELPPENVFPLHIAIELIALSFDGLLDIVKDYQSYPALKDLKEEIYDRKNEFLGQAKYRIHPSVENFHDLSTIIENCFFIRKLDSKLNAKKWLSCDEKGFLQLCKKADLNTQEQTVACFERILEDYLEYHLVDRDSGEVCDKKCIKHLVFPLIGMESGLSGILQDVVLSHEKIKDISLSSMQKIKSNIEQFESCKIPLIDRELPIEDREDLEALLNIFAMNLSYDSLYTAIKKVNFINKIPYDDNIHVRGLDKSFSEETEKLELVENEVLAAVLFKGDGSLSFHEDYEFGFRVVAIVNNSRKVGIIAYRGSCEKKDFNADFHMVSRAMPLSKEDTLARAIANYIICSSTVAASTVAASAASKALMPAPLSLGIEGVNLIRKAKFIFAVTALAVPLVSELCSKKVLQSYEASAMKYFTKMISLFPDHNFYMAGHSLGGYLAQYVCYKTQSDGMALNAPGIHEDDLKYKSRFRNLRTKGDIVSKVSSKCRIGENQVFDIATPSEKNRINPLYAIDLYLLQPHATEHVVNYLNNNLKSRYENDRQEN